MHKRSLKCNLNRSKRSLKITRVYEDEVIKLNTLKTRRLVRELLKSFKEHSSNHLYLIKTKRKSSWSFIVEKGPFVYQKDGRVKKVEEFDEFDSRKMTLNFQAINILSCGLDANKYNRVSGFDSAHEIWKLLEVTHEELKIKKKGKGLIGAWDQNSSEIEEEEGNANMCFMALESEDFSNLEFQKIVLENKNLCEKVLSLKKCMEDYNDLKKKVVVLDSGCSRHMTGNAFLISELKKTENGFVTFGDKKKGKIIGIGNIGNGSSSFIKDFDGKSDERIFLVYSSNKKAYRIYNKRTLYVEESINVNFDESNFFLKER
ncbi:hypothetical protein M9H77_13775 [Catharanthus roseus]|uniref:Uncharacterized protein n=1 Tax=Catharanthus roseus TaxID=4058 RepID=A0ACC0BL68_CATRO|nr:hypothetical protein M9H77_13775 [Catharanthus roseus]